MFIRRIPSQIQLADIKALIKLGKPRAETVAGILDNNNAVAKQVFSGLFL